MAIQTLFQIVQTIVYSMDGEEIQSIQDNYESRQVAQIVQEVFYNMVPRMDSPTHHTMFQLQAPPGGSSALYPTILQMPANCTQFDYISYDCHQSGTTDPLFTDLQYLPPHDFFYIMTQWSPSADTTVTQFNYTINGFAYNFEVNNQNPPTFWTSWDDLTVAFDSFDSNVDTFSNPAKTQVYGKLDQSFQLVDGYVPNLRSEQFPLLLAEAKSLAWAQMKQVTNAKAEKEISRQWTHYGKSRHTGPKGIDQYQQTRGYGRQNSEFTQSQIPRRLWMGK